MGHPARLASAARADAGCESSVRNRQHHHQPRVNRSIGFNARTSVAAALAICLVACSSAENRSGTPSSRGTDPISSDSTSPTTASSLTEATVQDTAASSPGTTPADSTLFGALPTAQLAADTGAKLQLIVDRASKTGDPAAIAAVMTPQGSWMGAAGIDGPDGRLATPQDQFAIASISKMFTAALILRLVDEGKIDLDQPLSNYLGALNADANGSTVRQALAMRSGIPDTASESIAKVVGAPEHIWTTAEVVAEFPMPVGRPEQSSTTPTRRTRCSTSQPNTSPAP